MREYLILFLISIVPISIHSLRHDQLIPFGRNAGDDHLPRDVEDMSSPEINLNINVKFFSREYGSIFVSILTK